VSDLPLGFRRVVTLFIARNKAVAIGAVSYYIDHFVTTRIAKFTYGLPSEIVYKPFDPEHVRRAHNTYVDAMGDMRVRNAFSTMLTRVRHSQPLLGTLD